MFELIVTIN